MHRGHRLQQAKAAPHKIVGHTTQEEVLLEPLHNIHRLHALHVPVVDGTYIMVTDTRVNTVLGEDII